MKGNRRCLIFGGLPVVIRTERLHAEIFHIWACWAHYTRTFQDDREAFIWKNGVTAYVLL